ncbi:MATE family efflux transporter [Mechercharimyces sp. CAU 1602]|uniref:MATE family efflux transporter n=1 Tax=Mechercharimyces sp. CAU 1602 TaxID=2973933 RepID=UPI0021633A09|nr:MATE family efflux transporter [Mechercharimyces sp. CAU 1602]MCS1352498.1 MATE family efflux transporter [Mechercharimyces sp. CAU 1602]
MGRLDYVHGNITKLLYLTFIPMLIASIVNVVMVVSQAVFIGQVGGEAVNIRGFYLPISFFMTALLEAMQLSTQVVLAKRKGAGQQKQIAQSFYRFLFFGLLLMGMFGVLIIVTLPLLTTFFGVDAAYAGLFQRFVSGMVVVELIVVMNIVIAASLRALGKVNIASFIAVMGSVLNIALMYYFILVRGMGLQGIVLAFLITSSLQFIASYSYIVWLKEIPIGFPRGIRGKDEMVTAILRGVGVPVFLSYCSITLGLLLFNLIMESFGDVAVGGYGAAYSIQTLVIIPGILLGSAMGIVMNQNLGSGKLERVFAVYKKGILQAFYFYLPLSLFVFLLREPLASVFFRAADREVFLPYAVGYLAIVAPTYLFMGPMLTTLITLEQMGKGMKALGMNLTYFLLIALLGWAVTTWTNDVSSFYWTVAFCNLIGISGLYYGYRLMHAEFSVSRQEGEEKEMVSGA